MVVKGSGVTPDLPCKIRSFCGRYCQGISDPASNELMNAKPCFDDIGDSKHIAIV